MDAIGIGWTFVTFGLMTLLTIPLIYLEIAFGPRCRRRRHLKDQRKEEARETIDDNTQSNK